jgi:exosortase
MWPSRGSWWARGLGFCGLSMLVLVAFREPLWDIVERGRGTVEQSYTLLVPLVALYVMLVRRSRIGGDRDHAGAAFGVALMVLAWGLLLIGHDRDVLVLWHAAPFVAMIGAVAAAFGIALLWRLLSGFLVLFAMIPVPGSVRLQIAQPLQELASGVTAFLLGLSGVPAVRMGSLIEINGAQVAVGEACNGMRLLMPLAVVMYAFVFSLPFRGSVRLMLLAMCLPVALLSNIIRLVPTAVSYGYFPRVAPQVHDYSGWLMIPLAILLLLAVLRVMEWFDLPVARYRLAMT